MYEKVETWVAGVKCMAGFVRGFPNAAYVRLTISLQQEWQIVQHMTPSVGTLYSPLEAVFRDDFLLTLLGGRREDITDYPARKPPGV